jgi:hypothetical protein
VATVYIDDGVQAPDGREYVIEAYRGDCSGPGTHPIAPSAAIGAVTGSRRRWKVRVRTWPAKLARSDDSWATVVDSVEAAELLCDTLQGLLEAGRWKPSDGEPPGIRVVGSD